MPDGDDAQPRPQLGDQGIGEPSPAAVVRKLHHVALRQVELLEHLPLGVARHQQRRGRPGRRARRARSRSRSGCPPRPAAAWSAGSAATSRRRRPTAAWSRDARPCPEAAMLRARSSSACEAYRRVRQDRGRDRRRGRPRPRARPRGRRGRATGRGGRSACTACRRRVAPSGAGPGVDEHRGTVRHLQQGGRPLADVEERQRRPVRRSRRSRRQQQRRRDERRRRGGERRPAAAVAHVGEQPAAGPRRESRDHGEPRQQRQDAAPAAASPPGTRTRRRAARRRGATRRAGTR